MAYEELTIEGRNAVIEAFRAGKTVDKIFVLEGCKDGPIQTMFCVKRKSRVPLSISSRKNAWINYQRQVSIKELLHIWRLMSIAQ